MAWRSIHTQASRIDFPLKAIRWPTEVYTSLPNGWSTGHRQMDQGGL